MKQVATGRFRLHGLAQEPHLRLSQAFASLVAIAAWAGANQVDPDMLAAPVARNDMIHGKVVRLPATVLAGVVISPKDLPAAETNARNGAPDHVLQPDDRRSWP